MAFGSAVKVRGWLEESRYLDRRYSHKLVIGCADADLARTCSICKLLLCAFEDLCVVRVLLLIIEPTTTSESHEVAKSMDTML